MSFFNDGYEIPVDSNYLVLEEGKNKLRILGTFSKGSAVMGYEGWADKKPIRARKKEEIDKTKLDPNRDGGSQEPKHFWALPVYSYKHKKVMCWVVKQKSIMFHIKELADNEDWGEPTQYDITVTKTVEGGQTRYPNTTPSPKAELSDDIVEEIANTPVDLTKLFDGENPFDF